MAVQNAFKAEMEKRKALHQKVLELKGAIRVFCRVRPLDASDGDAINCIEIKDQENLIVHVPQDERQHARSASAPIGRRNLSLPPERSKATGRECAYVSPSSPSSSSHCCLLYWPVCDT